MTALILTERVGDVALLRLSDEATLNALSPAMADELRGALVASAADHRAILLTGAGRAFCSGANLGGGSSAGPAPDVGEIVRRHYNPLMLAIRDLAVPIVTAVNGVAAGGGAPLALAGDLIVAARKSYFLQPFRNIGLVPDLGSAFLLTRAAGRARAMEMMLLGERVPAETALEWGMINRVVDADELLPAAMALAASLASGPTWSLAVTRRHCWRALEDGFEEQLAAEADDQGAASRTRDFREGITAFREKRPPRFTGD